MGPPSDGATLLNELFSNAKYSNTLSATSRAWTVCPSGAFLLVDHLLQSLIFYVVFCVDHVYLIVLFFLTMDLSVFRLTESVYSFGILKLPTTQALGGPC
jgi:hypothetical protein